LLTAQPFRKVKPNVRSVTGVYITRTGKPLEFESQLERDTYLMMDFELGVDDITAQPLRISNWVPDCEILSGERKYLVEIKYESELIAKWPEFSERYASLEEKVAREGFCFGVTTDASVYYPEIHRTAVLKSIKAHRIIRNIPERVEQEIKAVIHEGRPVTIRELAEKTGVGTSYARKVGMVCRFLCSGPVYALETPSPSLLDCLVSLPQRGSPALDVRIFSFQELRERIRTHPMRQLRQGVATPIV
jgi:hypothetical protein